jgi:acetyl esterase/lipase
MLKMLDMMAALASFFTVRRKLLKATDGYWRQKIGARALSVDGRVLNPRAQAMIEFQNRLTVPKKHWTPQLVRKGFEKSVEFFDGKARAVAHVKDIKVSIQDRSLKARHYSNEISASLRPCILFFHGGGFVIGSLDGYDNLCRNLALQSNCDVVSIEYRLAPEHKFPAAFEDAIGSWEWIQEEGEKLHIDPARISVAGDSAGAFLALLVASEASKAKTGNRPLALGLIYPPDFTVTEANSRKLLGDQKVVLNRELLEWFMKHFLPDGVSYDDERFEVLGDAVNGRMPPTWILTCGFDPLRDDGIAIAKVLSDLGAEVTFQEYDDLYHGFITLSGVFPQVQSMLEDLGGFFARHNSTIAPKGKTATG